MPLIASGAGVRTRSTPFSLTSGYGDLLSTLLMTDYQSFLVRLELVKESKSGKVSPGHESKLICKNLGRSDVGKRNMSQGWPQP